MGFALEETIIYDPDFSLGKRSPRALPGELVPPDHASALTEHQERCLRALHKDDWSKQKLNKLSEEAGRSKEWLIIPLSEVAAAIATECTRALPDHKEIREIVVFSESLHKAAARVRDLNEKRFWNAEQIGAQKAAVFDFAYLMDSYASKLRLRAEGHDRRRKLRLHPKVGSTEHRAVNEILGMIRELTGRECVETVCALIGHLLHEIHGKGWAAPQAATYRKRKYRQQARKK
jgi:hypothetical protein